MTATASRRRLPRRTAGVLVLVLVPGVAVLPGVAQAATDPGVPATSVASTAATPSIVAASSAYRYWSYWWGQADGGWTYASMGAPSTQPKDGAVEGWRFAISGDGPSSARAPRTQANMATLCPDLKAAPSGQKRVAVVLDFGTAAEAPRGESPPPARVACVVVPSSANGVQVLAAATSIRSKDGLVCALSGYPQAECATAVATTPATPARPPVRKPVRAPIATPPKKPVRKPAGATSPPVTPSQPDAATVGEPNGAPNPIEVPAADDSQYGDESTVDSGAATGEAAAPSGALAGQPGETATGALAAEAQSSGDGRTPDDIGGESDAPAATEAGETVPTTSAMAEEPVAFVRQDSETSSSASKVATLAGVTAVIVALAGFWLFTSRRKKARAAASFRHRRHN